MYIKPVKKWRQPKDGEVMVPYLYYRLCESYRGENGRSRQRMIMGLGELEGMNSEEDLKELARLLTSLITRGEYLISEKQELAEKAIEFYNRYRQEKQTEKEQSHNSEQLNKECDRKEKSRIQDIVAVKWSSLKTMAARTVGAEHVCKAIADELQIERHLIKAGLSAEQAKLATLQTVARAIYPVSEFKTVRVLQENSALCELFGVDPKTITKDKLYKSADLLYSVHKEVEDALHSRVCSIFDFDERILLFDLTNTYFEGRMEHSEICKFGRSKEKRNDARIVVLAAVVNRDGMLVRTKIYEGSRQDVNTLEEVIGSLSDNPVTASGAKKLVVIDAGFSSKDNLKWLRKNQYDYITVMRTRGVNYKEIGEVRTVHDSYGQELMLQLVEVDGIDDKVVMVESSAKADTQRSMLNQQMERYEQGLLAIRQGIKGRGTKKRDKVNNRLGRLKEKYPAAAALYSIVLKYDEKQAVAVDIEWTSNAEKEEEINRLRGRYLLQTTLDETVAENIWELYNVIRNVEETFKVLKSDLEIRPVYHKKDGGIKAHLNLAVMAYWIVSTARYRLKQQGITWRWDELLRILSAQQRITVDVEKANGNHLQTRSTTEPEEKAQRIFRALGLSSKPTCNIKFVWHPEPPPKKHLSSKPSS